MILLSRFPTLYTPHATSYPPISSQLFVSTSSSTGGLTRSRALRQDSTTTFFWRPHMMLISTSESQRGVPGDYLQRGSPI